MPVTFQDIFKTSFLEKAAAVPLLDMAVALVLSFLLGLFVFFIYKQCYAGVMYSPSFGVTLVALCLITTLLILTVVSNIVLSLGMVGALSIVRFRTAIKEPMDIAFLFWAIAAGIVLAAGLVFLAVGGSLFIGAVLYAFSRRRSPDTPYILMVHCDSGEVENRAKELIASQVKRMQLKSKSVEQGLVELHWEVRLKEGDAAFLEELERMEGVGRAVLVSYNGDYMG